MGRGIYHCTRAQDPQQSLCVVPFTWLEYVLQNPTDSCRIQHRKCLFVLDGLVGTPAPPGGSLWHGWHRVHQANQFSDFYVTAGHGTSRCVTGFEPPPMLVSHLQPNALPNKVRVRVKTHPNPNLKTGWHFSSHKKTCLKFISATHRMFGGFGVPWTPQPPPPPPPRHPSALDGQCRRWIHVPHTNPSSSHSDIYASVHNVCREVGLAPPSTTGGSG